MAWAEGFPGILPDAPWNRLIQTGTYSMVLNTASLQVPHLGPVLDGTPAAGSPSPAELDLTLTVNGRSYHCREGGKWGRFTGPRLVESGRFLQRADVTDLVFKSAEGERLNVEARLETVAWADRLALIFAARPGLQLIQAGEASFGKIGGGFGLDGTNHLEIPHDPSLDPEQTRSSEQWKNSSMEIKLTTAQGAMSLRDRWDQPPGETWESPAWREVSLAFNPASFKAEEKNSPVIVKASAIPGLAPCPVDYDPSRGWHRVHLDKIEPTPPPGAKNPSNDAIERVRLSLTNPTADEQIVRLMFEKNQILQGIGSAITGISAILRDSEGNPTGIPVQLSKNWHNQPGAGTYAGHWFHGISQVRLPPGATAELELTLAYGHWGGVAAASHAQLSLVGWGSNQLWEQSALGAWGESLCYEPDQAQANCTITDVRPLMVKSGVDTSKWGWTSNVGGGDFFRFFDPAGKRIPHSAMRSTSHRQGPCLTEVTYAGRIGANLKQAMTVSLARTDDIVRGIYRIRLDVDQPTDFSRFVIFQIGADTYSYTGERRMALGDETGLLREWDTQWGGSTYRTPPMECRGRIPWASLHQAVPPANEKTVAWANRGIVIRSWKARLGGKDASPWMAEHGTTIGRNDSSTLDIVPPPGVTRLEPGDFVEATIELIVMPQFAKDYYGPNESLRTALQQDENSWRMIHREAIGNDPVVKMETGTLERLQPDIRIRTDQDAARLDLSGGLGFIPITFTGLSSHRGYWLEIDGKALDQSVHGNDFWQTDYDPSTRRWSQTYNIPAAGGNPRTIQFRQRPSQSKHSS